MLWGNSELERGIAIGGIASTVMPYLLRFVGQILIAAVTAFAAAIGKELFAEYVRRNFKQRRKDNR